MKTLWLTLMLGIFCFQNQSKKQIQPINQVMGDAGYEYFYGKKPDTKTLDWVRIQAHLHYVEETLHQKNVATLSESQRENRKTALALLKNYWQRGSFPSNYDYQNERKPCFLDRDKVICAVGYLIQQTKGDAVVAEINQRYQYATIDDMQMPEIAAWATEYGFSLKELCMIQPTYAPTPYENAYIDPKYGGWSAVVTGVGLSTNILNTMHLYKGNTHLAPSIIGIASGLTSFTMGAVKLKSAYPIIGSGLGNASRNLAFFNLGFGAFTTSMSAFSLFAHKPKDKRTSFHLYNGATIAQKPVLGLGINHVF